jgi:amino acid transporter
MATVSSANASIMSASRISFAMGRDKLIWDWLNVVHPRFRVPPPGDRRYRGTDDGGHRLR